MKPSPEKILSVLIDLYAKQNGVKATYIIETKKEKEKCLKPLSGVS